MISSTANLARGSDRKDKERVLSEQYHTRVKEICHENKRLASAVKKLKMELSS
jgi:hypothetical protein